jgi:regulator of replication initiation timing
MTNKDLYLEIERIKIKLETLERAIERIEREREYNSSSNSSLSLENNTVQAILSKLLETISKNDKV